VTVSPIIVPKIPVIETPKIVSETIETIDETIQETGQKIEKICPICREKFEPKPSKKEYCCSKCRLIAYRRRVAEESK